MLPRVDRVSTTRASALQFCATADAAPSAPAAYILQVDITENVLVTIAGRSRLLQINGLIMPGLVELRAPYFVYALMLGAAEDHGRAEPNVEVAQIF